MPKQRRYGLIALDPNTNYRTLFGVDIDGLNIKTFKKSKTTLPEIDKYTMQFNDINELERDLFERGIIDADVAIFVEYKQKHDFNGETIENSQTDILYKEDYEAMKHFTDQLSTNVNSYTEEFATFYKRVVDNKDTEWWAFLHKYGYMSDILYENLVERRKPNSNINESRLVNLLTNYKAIRSIYIGTKKYIAKKNNFESDINLELGTKIKEINDEINEIIDYHENTDLIKLK